MDVAADSWAIPASVPLESTFGPRRGLRDVALADRLSHSHAVPGAGRHARGRGLSQPRHLSLVESDKAKAVSEWSAASCPGTVIRTCLAARAYNFPTPLARVIPSDWRSPEGFRPSSRMGARDAAGLLRRGATESLRALVARGSRPVISTRRPLRRCITDRQAGPLPAKDVRVPMARAVQHRKFTLKPAAAAWIEPSGRTHSREKCNDSACARGPTRCSTWACIFGPRWLI